MAPLRQRPPRQNGTAHPDEGIAMDAMKTWTVQVDIDEHEDRTRAVARLVTGGDRPLDGTGLARTPQTATCPRSETSWRSLAPCRS